MQNWSRDNAVRALEALAPNGFNREIADYWLSLWDGDTPPSRASFDPMKVTRHLPSIAMFEVRPGCSVRCRVAGNHFRLALGYELTGLDLLSVTPADQKAARMANVAAIVKGAATIGHRRVIGADGTSMLVEEVVLPFADCAEDGSHRYLVHSNWRPQRGEWFPGHMRTDAGIVNDQRFIPLDSNGAMRLSKFA